MRSIAPHHHLLGDRLMGFRCTVPLVEARRGELGPSGLRIWILRLGGMFSYFLFQFLYFINIKIWFFFFSGDKIVTNYFCYS